MSWIKERPGRCCLVLCALVLAFATVGCSGGGSDEESTDTTVASNFTPDQVEKTITRTIEPTLEANLGSGYTMTVDCAEAEPGFRCEYQAYAPNGRPVRDQRVIYAVTCNARCSWIPVG